MNTLQRPSPADIGTRTGTASNLSTTDARRLRPWLAGLSLALALGLATVAGTGEALAADVIVYRAGDRIDPAAVAHILGAQPMQRPAGVRTRSLRLLDDPAPQAGTGQAVANPVAIAGSPVAVIDNERSPTSLSLPVPFAFDSADLLPDARLQLDAVAEGIQMLPPDRRIVIEGHTDAVGPDAYNHTLSERRAEAVRHYLVLNHGIPARRLMTVGFGKAAPLDQLRPQAGINRRVQFRGS